MLENRRIVVVGLASVLILVGLLLRLVRRELVYNGAPLSAWLDEVHAGSSSASPASFNASLAVQHIGTNAIPELLLRLQSNDSRLKQWVIDLVGRQRLIRFPIGTEADRRAAGILGFSALRSNASPAIPQLIQMLDDREPLRLSGTESALTSIEGPILSPLQDALTNQNRYIRRGAVRTLANYANEWRLHNKAGESNPISALTSGVTNSDPDVREIAVFALGNCQKLAEESLPLLVNALRDENPEVRREAAGALGKIGINEGLCLPALVLALQDSEAFVRSFAANSIGEFANTSDTAMNALRQATKSTNAELRAAAWSALEHGRVTK